MDPLTAAGLVSGGLDMGGGSITPSSSATANNKGGPNTVGGTVFGNYSAAPSATSSMIPLLVGGVVLLGAIFMMKGGK